MLFTVDHDEIRRSLQNLFGKPLHTFPIIL